jgi:hypothetical protein
MPDWWPVGIWLNESVADQLPIRYQSVIWPIDDWFIIFRPMAGKRSGRQKASGEYTKKGYESNIAWTNSALRASFPAIKRVMEGRIAHLDHQFGTSCFNLAIKKVIQDRIARMGTNSALCASSPAIKRVTKGGIAHLSYQFGTSCLNSAIKKWVNGLQNIFGK